MKLSIEQVAALCHEANREYCKAIGDHSQVEWIDAPQWQRSSAISGVKFRLRYPDADPSQSHSNWLNVKLSDGWSYGPVKDPEKKEHPCMRPFYDLPPEQQAKDHLFTGIISALLAAQMIEGG